jgi:hypothetical protein
MSNLNAVSLSLGKDGGKRISGRSIVIYDDTGLPIIACEKHGDKITIVRSYEKPEEMKEFLARNGLPPLLDSSHYPEKL